MNKHFVYYRDQLSEINSDCIERGIIIFFIKLDSAYYAVLYQTWHKILLESFVFRFIFIDCS